MDWLPNATNEIGLITRLYTYVPRKTLINIYKFFIPPHLDYGDISYDDPSNIIFLHKIQSIQYNVALAITCTKLLTSQEKLCKELGLEHLHNRRWYILLFFCLTKLKTI